VLKNIERQEKILIKLDKKNDLPRYVSTILDQAQNYFKIYQKENCIEKLNQAVGYCQSHPNVPIKGKYAFSLMDTSDSLATEIEKLYDFYFGLYNKYEDLSKSNKIHYQGQCVLAQSQSDILKKTGSVIPIPFIANIKKRRQYEDIFTHLGWVFATDSHLSFLLLPSVIILDSQGMMSSDQYLKCYCSFPEVIDIKLDYSQISDPFMVDHHVPKNKTVRMTTADRNIDIMIYENKHLNILNNWIVNQTKLEISNLVFTPSYQASLTFPYIKKGLQKEFIKVVTDLKNS
jgi:hypothetical protein